MLVIAAAIATLGLAGGAYHLFLRRTPGDHLRAETLIAKGDRKGADIVLKSALLQD